MAASRCEQPQPLEDIAEAYRRLAPRLEQIVRLNLSASDAVVEEACQAAWGRLLDHRDHVRTDSALSWLATTAVREALKLLRHERRQLSLEEAIDRGAEGALGLEPGPAPALGPETLVERRERLAELSALPRRQQRLLWLRGLGLSYEEIARHTGDSTRTVERQLVQARRRLRAVAA